MPDLERIRARRQFPDAKPTGRVRDPVVRSRHHDDISLHLRVDVAENRVYTRSPEPMAAPLPRRVRTEIEVLPERVGAEDVVKQRIAIPELDFLTRILSPDELKQRTTAATRA